MKKKTMMIMTMPVSRRGRPAPAGILVPAALLLGCLAGCDLLLSHGDSAAPRTILIGRTFVMEEGTAVRLGGGGPLLSFEDVPEDSRCPSNVMCVWAGRARAIFDLAGSERDTTFVLTIPGLTPTPYEQNEELPVQGLEFQLLELSPYPVFRYPIVHRDEPRPLASAVIRIRKLED